MKSFRGFKEKDNTFTSIPHQFFSELLPAIDHLGELKTLLYFFWRLEQMEGPFRYLRLSDIIADTTFVHSLASETSQAIALLEDSLERSVAHGVLLKSVLTSPTRQETLYFLNSPRGRAAIKAIAVGKWRPDETTPTPQVLSQDRPNVFRLYEEHIGPLTPLIADALREAETTYPATWIEQAFRIAVENNVRRWSYIQAILTRWQEEGRDERKDRRDTEKDRRRYIEGEFSEYIKH